MKELTKSSFVDDAGLVKEPAFAISCVSLSFLISFSNCFVAFCRSYSISCCLEFNSALSFREAAS